MRSACPTSHSQRALPEFTERRAPALVLRGRLVRRRAQPTHLHATRDTLGRPSIAEQGVSPGTGRAASGPRGHIHCGSTALEAQQAELPRQLQGPRHALEAADGARAQGARQGMQMEGLHALTPAKRLGLGLQHGRAEGSASTRTSSRRARSAPRPVPGCDDERALTWSVGIMHMPLQTFVRAPKRSRQCQGLHRCQARAGPCRPCPAAVCACRATARSRSSRAGGERPERDGVGGGLWRVRESQEGRHRRRPRSAVAQPS